MPAFSSRRRAYARALRAAYQLSGLGPTNRLYFDGIDGRGATAHPEIVERYRLLLLAMAIIRGGPGGTAVAALLRRGYVLAPDAQMRGLPDGLRRIDAGALVWLFGGLPVLGRPWKSISRAALAVDVDALPQNSLVPAHVSLRIRAELRAEGHDLGGRPSRPRPRNPAGLDAQTCGRRTEPAHMTSRENCPPTLVPSTDVEPTGSDDLARLLADRERRRAFELARHQASLIAKWVGLTHTISGELIERYRLLIIAMETARGTPGALALAELARRGYVLDGTAWMPAICRIDRGSVIGGGGLPRRPSRSLAAMERRVATIDLASYPPLSLVSSHEAIRIREELRREGHDLG